MKKPVRPIKIITIILSSIAFLLICAVAWFVLTLNATFHDGITTNDINEYVNGNYLTYTGSDAVINFFPRYSELTDFSNIEFHYFNGSHKSTFFHKFFISFALDVRYNSNEIYTQKASELLSAITTIYHKGGDAWGDFLLYQVETSNKNIVQCIGFNDSNYTIRYIAFYGNGVDMVDIYTLITWNTTSALTWPLDGSS